jgi:hypothetical protein
MFKKISIAVATILALSAYAEDVPIIGNVASKCSIHTDTSGVYGNPSANTLSTLAVDGGVQPIIRYDVVNANSYKAVISTPMGFSSSPSLSDSVAWTGLTEVASVTNPLQSAYDTNKRIYNNTSEFDLTVAGTVWFKVTSKAEYGYNKSFPGGTYKAIVTAECIAK